MPMTSNNLHHYGAPPNFGDAHTRMLYEQKCEKAKDKQTCRFAVAPDCSVHSATRGKLLPGDEVTENDFHGSGGVLRELVARRAILDVPEDDLKRRAKWANATHRVDPERRKGIGTMHGTVLVPGEFCSADDFAKPAQPKRRYISRETGLEQTAAEVPATDGKATLTNLVAKGYIIEAPKKQKRA